MKILVEDPPFNIRALCEEVFDLSGLQPCWTFADTLYNPHNGRIDKALFAHEGTHSIQQGDTPVKWWMQYLEDPAFRFAQELEAYRVQYKVLQEELKDRNALYRALVAIASDLSGKMYGNMCPTTEAMRLIRLIR